MIDDPYRAIIESADDPIFIADRDGRYVYGNPKAAANLGLTQEQFLGKTVDEILANLEKNYPGMKERICDENGQIRRFINVFVNGEDIRFKDGSKTAVAEGAEISIIPAIAGGSW